MLFFPQTLSPNPAGCMSSAVMFHAAVFRRMECFDAVEADVAIRPELRLRAAVCDAVLKAAVPRASALICAARNLREECRSCSSGQRVRMGEAGAAKRNSGAALQAKRPAGRSARVLYCGGVEVPVAGVAAAAAGAAGAVSAVGAAAGGVTGAAGVAAGGASAGAVGAV